MKTLAVAIALAALAPAGAVSAQGVGQAPAQAQTPVQRPNALVEFPARGGARLTVTTPGWKDGGEIAFEFTQYRTNTFPGLAWSRGPAGTKSYAVIMQDTGGSMRGLPYLHWVLYNVPADVTTLPAGMAPEAKPAGSAYGPNYMGQARPYLGPRTPPGPPHPYHLQVFALDTVIPEDPAITYDALTSAMKDHILASGEVIGMGRADPDAPPRPPRPASN